MPSTGRRNTWPADSRTEVRLHDNVEVTIEKLIKFDFSQQDSIKHTLPSHLLNHHHQHNTIKLKNNDLPYALNLACKELSYKPQLHTTSHTRLIICNRQLKERILALRHDYKICKLAKMQKTQKRN